MHLNLNMIRDRIPSRHPADEQGFSIALVIMIMAVVLLFSTVALTTTMGGLRLTRHDLDQNRAFQAAQAGIAEYAFQLSSNTNFWSLCTNVPSPNAINQQGSTAKTRTVPGTTGATYAIELLPATGNASCSTSDPIGTMIEQTGPSTGTFRIRATGFAQGVERQVVATFKRASFLDYLYFTDLETIDPVYYPDAATRTHAYTQCTKYIREGRRNVNLTNFGAPCLGIVFVSDEDVNGPLHTNDELLACGSPNFGRNLADTIEVSAPPVGWSSSGCAGGASPNFRGAFMTNAPVLTPPPNNKGLRKYAIDDNAEYAGQHAICLNGNNYTVRAGQTCTGGTTRAIPSNGVIYVRNSTSCTAEYRSVGVVYANEQAGCGTVFVSGTYSGRLTIGAENDIVVRGNIIRSGDGVLGLIPENFLRVYHPVTFGSGLSSTNTCPSGSSNATGFLQNPRIDAAILAIQHSFIVDNWNCGAEMGTLTVNGAIAQRFRGPVGQVSGTTATAGYSKNYNYDDRLRAISPPYFIDPVQSAWRVERQTLDFE